MPDLSSTNLAIVDANNTANHLWHDNHVTQVSLDDCWLFVGRGFLLRLAEFFDETHWAALETALEPSAGTGMNELRVEGSD